MLPEEWRLGRRLGSTRLDEGLVSADFASAETFQILTEELAPLLVRFDLKEFDLSLITSRKRRVTQEAARYAYELAGSGKVFAGVRYCRASTRPGSCGPCSTTVWSTRLTNSPRPYARTIRAC